MRLDGKVALITGSTSGGMGRSTALTLAHRGADIILNYGTNPRQGTSSAEAFGTLTSRTDEEAEKAARIVEKAIREMGRRTMLIKANTKQEVGVRNMVEDAIKEFGRIDILINNACGAWDVRDYTDISFDHWRDVLAAEIDGPFLTMKYVLPGMRERQWGRIIHIGLSGALHMEGMKGIAPDFALGKAVRRWMTTALGLEEFDSGITVNCIEPGVTAHMSFEKALKAAQGNVAEWEQRKNVNCHDVAEIVAFLCSEAGRFVSGSTVRLPTV